MSGGFSVEPLRGEVKSARQDGGRLILVVDDNPQIRQVVRDTLEDEGWQVRTAEDGQQATDLAVPHPPALVVLDLALPVFDGFAVAKNLRAAYGADLPILVMSADGRTAEKAAQVGAYAYLRKPFSLDALVAAVKAGLGEN